MMAAGEESDRTTWRARVHGTRIRPLADRGAVSATTAHKRSERPSTPLLDRHDLRAAVGHDSPSSADGGTFPSEIPMIERNGHAATRHSDPATSHEAGRAVSERLTELQERVMAALREHGAMSGRQMERLTEFSDLSPSTVRKRLCELHHGGVLEACGVEKDSGRTNCTVYRVRHHPKGALYD